ncbi:MAG: hypothetical protein ABIH67_03580 [Candidatus Uhrbacteria bacterium]
MEETMDTHQPVTALVHVPEKPELPKNTPLSRFIDVLLSQYDSNTERVLGGVASWIPLPVEEVIFLGLWGVIISIAKKLGRTVDSQFNIQEFSQKATRLINAGLYLAYDSDQEATEAFQDQVIGSVFQALQLGYLPGMNLPAQLENTAWQALMNGNDLPMRQLVAKADQPVNGAMHQIWLLPSRQFFMRLVRTAIEQGKTIARLEAKFNQNNLISAKGFRFCLARPVYTDTLTDFLSIRSDLDVTDPEKINRLCERSANASGWLTSELNKQEMLRALPYQLQNLPEDVFTGSESGKGTGDSLEDRWISTQLFLTALQAEDREYLKSGDEYLLALSELKKVKTADLIHGFMHRMQARGCQFEGVQRMYLVELLQSKITTLRSRAEDIALGTIENSFICLPLEHMLFNPDEALDILVLGEQTPLGMKITELSEKEQLPIFDRLIDSVFWDSLEAKQIYRIFRREFVPAEKLIVGMFQIEPEVCSEATKMLLADSDTAERYLALLLEHEFIQVNSEMLHNHTQLIPEKELVKVINSRLSAGMFIDPLIMLKALCQLSKQAAQAICQEPEYRTHLDNEFFYEVARLDNQAKNRVSTSDAQQLREHLGEDIWSRFILANEVMIERATAYEGSDDADPELYWPWAQVAQDVHAQQVMNQAFGLTPEELIALHQHYSEDEIFNWYKQGDVDRQALYQRFLENRQRYYADLGIST